MTNFSNTSVLDTLQEVQNARIGFFNTSAVVKNMPPIIRERHGTELPTQDKQMVAQCAAKMKEYEEALWQLEAKAKTAIAGATDANAERIKTEYIKAVTEFGEKWLLQYDKIQQAIPTGEINVTPGKERADGSVKRSDISQYVKAVEQRIRQHPNIIDI